MLESAMVKGVLPDTYGLDAQARFLMIHELEHRVDATWMNLFEDVFAELGAPPFEGTGFLGEKKSHGSYRRVRKKLGEFLDSSTSGDNFGVRIRSESKYPEEGFFPSDLGIFLGQSNIRPTYIGIAARPPFVHNVDALIEKIGKARFEVFGTFYGGAWDFPTAFDPEGYLVSVGAIPKGHKWGSNREYSERLTRWEDNIWRRKLRASRGYFREIYPINFLLETHLNMPFRDEPLSKFMEATGALRPFEFNEKMYRWDVPDETLNEVREALEPSGLILSSDVEPLQIN